MLPSTDCNMPAWLFWIHEVTTISTNIFVGKCWDTTTLHASLIIFWEIKNATRSLWPSDYDIEVSDDTKSNVEDYFDLLEFGEEHDVEFIYTYINGEWMVTNKDHENNYKPFSTLKSFFDGRPFHR